MSRGKWSKEVLSLEHIDKVVSEELRIYMHASNAKWRIQKLYIHYRTILRRNGLSWIKKDYQSAAIFHVLSNICRESLQSRPECDIDFFSPNLYKDFAGCIKHAMRLSKAFQLVENDKEMSQSSSSVKKNSTEAAIRSNSAARLLCASRVRHAHCVFTIRTNCAASVTFSATAGNDTKTRILNKASAGERARTGLFKSVRRQL